MHTTLDQAVTTPIPLGARVAYVGSQIEEHGLARVSATYLDRDGLRRYVLILDRPATPYGDTLTHVRAQSVRILMRWDA